MGRGSLYTLGTAAPIIAQGAVTPAVTRLFDSPADYGVIPPSLVVVQVMMMLASLGIPSVITRHALLERSGTPGARSLLLRGSGLTTLLVVALLAASPVWTRLAPEPSRTAWVVAVLAGGLFVIVENCQSMLRALDRPISFVALSSVAALGGPVVGLVLLLVIDQTPALYLAGLAVGYGTAALLGLWFCLARQPHHSQPGDLGRALRLGLPVLPHLVALYLANGSLVLLAERWHGPADAGRLGIALLIGASPAVVTSALNNSWAPVVYRAAEAERPLVLQHTAKAFATLSALVAGGVALLSPWLLRFAADERYQPTDLVVPVAIIAAGATLSVAYLANVHLVFAAGRSLGLSITTPLALAAGITVAATAGRTSLLWVAAGFPATYAALAILTGVLRRRIGGPSWRESVLVGPGLVGAGLLVAGALLPVSGAGALSRVVLALAAGVVLVRFVRQVLGQGTEPSR